MVIALYFLPPSHLGAYACSHPLLTWVPFAHSHTLRLTHTTLAPYLLMSLLAHGHCALWQTQALRQVLIPTPADLHAYTHLCVCHSHTPSFA